MDEVPEHMCSKCNETKFVYQFYRVKGQLTNVCKQCHRKRVEVSQQKAKVPVIDGKVGWQKYRRFNFGKKKYDF